jgi:hypothetical protein
MGDFGIPMRDFLGNEAGPEDARIGYHMHWVLGPPL